MTATAVSDCAHIGVLTARLDALEARMTRVERTQGQTFSAPAGASELLARNPAAQNPDVTQPPAAAADEALVRELSECLHNACLFETGRRQGEDDWTSVARATIAFLAARRPSDPWRYLANIGECETEMVLLTTDGRGYYVWPTTTASERGAQIHKLWMPIHPPSKP